MGALLFHFEKQILRRHLVGQLSLRPGHTRDVTQILAFQDVASTLLTPAVTQICDSVPQYVNQRHR